MKRALLLLATGCNSIVGVHDVTLGGADAAIDAPVRADAKVADAPVSSDGGLPDASPIDAVQPDAWVCGDGVCATGETCAKDCPVTGLVQTRYIAEDGTETLVPTDLSAQPIVALVLTDASTATFVSYPGTGAADGTFTIPDVPFGEYYLNVGIPSYTVTSARYTDLTTNVLGRPNPAIDKVAALSLDIGNMTPWGGPEDNIQIIANNCGGYGFDQPPFQVGATTATFTAPWGVFNQPLVQFSQGDKLDVWHQTTTHPMTGVTESLLTDYLEVSVEMKPNTTTPVTGTFLQTTGTTESAHLSLSIDEWAALGPTAAWPLVPPTADGVIVTDEPGTAKYGQLSGSDDLLDFSIDLGTISTGTLDFGTASYVNPFRTSLENVIAWRAETAGVMIDDADPSLPGEIGAGLIAYAPGGTQGLQHPLVGPVGNITLNGVALTSDQYDVAKDAITFSWTAPTLGKPDFYVVQLWGLRLTKARAVGGSPILTFTTKDTQVTLPPGYLSADTPYLPVVEAHEGTSAPYGVATQVPRVFRTGAKPTPCGGLNQACCTSAITGVTSFNKCNLGGTCDASTSTCVPCGAEGGPCCATSFDSPCADETKDVCDGTSCVPCGGPGQICCDYYACSGGGCCVGDTCYADGASCGSGTCSSGSCGGCGAAGQTCCNGTDCTSGDCDASSTMCTACGDFNQPCCGGSFCYSGMFCSSYGTCQ